MGRAVLASGALGQHQGLPTTIIVQTTLQDLHEAAGAALTGGGTRVPISDVIRMASSAYPYLAIFDKHSNRPRSTSGAPASPAPISASCSTPSLAAALPLHQGFVRAPIWVACRNSRPGGRSGFYVLAVSEMDRRRMMLMTGIGLLAAAMPIQEAEAHAPRQDVPSGRVPPPAAPPSNPAQGTYLFSDEFDGPAGSAPDPTKWTVATFREPIKNPVFWDRAENLGQYRDDRRNVFVDGNSNLVLRATKEGNPDQGAGIAGTYFSGKVQGTWWGGIGTTWEARIKFNCLTAGCWPAWWLSNNDPAVGSEVDLVEWYGNRDWPSGTTVHARPDGTSFATQPVGVDSGWHRWRVTWNAPGMYFWEDYVSGAEPYFTVPANSLDDWPFNFPDYRVFPVLNLAVSGSGGRDPRPGTYPADMVVDWVRVW